ncbi:PQQ-binding-like beta-propeller repeat protein [Egicoccus sp. AB-alg6-2]|uniref:outer membrane protein assembly factor BamB family protein n=1 Tax=Egicoccus sp. AB-alg6-2 TaxID=3242692 RepID=UPI00359D0047
MARRTDIGERTCGDCGEVWGSSRARFCGRCGAALVGSTPAAPWIARTWPGRWRTLVPVFAGVVAVTLLATWSGAWSGAWTGAPTRPPEMRVEVPPEPPPPAPTPPSRADTPPVPVRCRTSVDCIRWRLPPTPAGAGSPAVTRNGHLVVVTADGLAGFEVHSGTLRWELAWGDGTRAADASLAPVHGTDAVVVVVPERVLAVAAGTGEVLWDEAVEGARTARSARAVDDRWYLAVRVREGPAPTSFVAAVAVDGATGATRWREQDAHAVFSADGPVLQDTEGGLRGLDPADGSERWAVATGRPSARLIPLGSRLVVSSRDDGLVVDTHDGTILEHLDRPMSSLLVRDDVMVWGAADRVDYLDGGGRRWQRTIEDLDGCCSGFDLDAESVTVLTGGRELVRLARDTGAVESRTPLSGQLADHTTAWLQGRLLVVPVPGTSGGLAQIHDARTGAHVADVTAEATGLAHTDAGDWLVFAPGLGLTLRAPSP